MPKKNNPEAITMDSYNELAFRVRMTLDAVNLYYYFGQGLEEVYSGQGIDETPEFKTRNIVTQFAFIQMSAIFDSQGRFSLHVKEIKESGKIHIKEKRLRALFPIFQDCDLKIFEADLNKVPIKYQSTIKIITQIRNEKIGHLVKKSQKIRECGGYVEFSHKTQIPRSFSYKQITDLCMDLRSSLLDRVQNRLEFGEL